VKTKTVTSSRTKEIRMEPIEKTMERTAHKEHRLNQSTGIGHPIRVLLIDASALTLHGLRTFLAKSPHIEIIGSASSPPEAMIAIQTARPDVVILEVRVGQASGIDLCKTIRETHPHIGVLFFTAHDDTHFLHSAILAGAQGYILKTAAAEVVAKSIEIVATGQAIMDQHVTEQVISWMRAGKVPVSARDGKLTSKEDLTLLSLVASGKMNKEIAQELKIAPAAVATRLNKLYKRLGISRRTEAARYFAQAHVDETSLS
jgi:two-component system response regulator DevR